MKLRPRRPPPLRTRPLARRLLLPLLGLVVFPLAIGTFATLQIRHVAAEQAASSAVLRDHIAAVTDVATRFDTATDALVDARLDDRPLRRDTVAVVVAETERALDAAARSFDDPDAAAVLATLDSRWEIQRERLEGGVGAVPGAIRARAAIRERQRVDALVARLVGPPADQEVGSGDRLQLVARVLPIAVTIGVGTLAVLLAWTARRIQRLVLDPLTALRAAAWRLAEGDLGTRVDLERHGVGDEFGHVAEVFDHMAERLERAHRDLHHRATHDPLTDLPNRGQLAPLLTSALARAGRRDHVIGVLALDLDGFKETNDALGHAAGDQVLRTVAERLRATVRRGDEVVRMGGDEFVVVLTGDDERTLRAAADRITRDVSGPVETTHGTAAVGVSGGLAVHPTHGDAPEVLCRNADTAMYRAKSAGRRCMVHSGQGDAGPSGTDDGSDRVVTGSGPDAARSPVPAAPGEDDLRP